MLMTKLMLIMHLPLFLLSSSDSYLYFHCVVCVCCYYDYLWIVVNLSTHMTNCRGWGGERDCKRNVLAIFVWESDCKRNVLAIFVVLRRVEGERSIELIDLILRLFFTLLNFLLFSSSHASRI